MKKTNELKTIRLRSRSSVYDALLYLGESDFYCDDDGFIYHERDVLALDEKEQDHFIRCGDLLPFSLSEMDPEKRLFSRLVLTDSYGGRISLEHFSSIEGHGPYQNTVQHYEAYSLLEAYLHYYELVKSNYLVLLDQFYNWDLYWTEDEFPKIHRFYQSYGFPKELRTLIQIK